MPDLPLKPTITPRMLHKSIRAALLHKEWQEQRWRFFLGAIVLSALLAGMLRAQIIPSVEAAVLIYWPVGILITVFLAMGPVAMERADRTWEFLVAQPISRAEVLLAKWRAGLWQLVGIMAIATVAGALALWSRGLRVMPGQGSSELTGEAFPGMPRWLSGDGGILAQVSSILHEAPSTHPILWLGLVGIVSTAALASCYTPFFFILSRARNEFTAGLGGILLAIVVHVWLMQLMAVAIGREWLLVPALLNPLAPLVLIWFPQTAVFLPILMVFHGLLWVVLPCVVVRRVARKAV